MGKLGIRLLLASVKNIEKLEDPYDYNKEDLSWDLMVQDMQILFFFLIFFNTWNLCYADTTTGVILWQGHVLDMAILKYLDPRTWLYVHFL